MTFNKDKLTDRERIAYDRLDQESKQQYEAAWIQMNLLTSKPCVYGYARVSSRGQAADGNGLDAQVEQLRAAGAVDIYKDVMTGTTLERPELQRLVGNVKAGDTIVVTKLDRLARTASDGIEIIDKLMAAGVKVHVLNMGLMDGSPMGRLIRQVVFAFSEFERDMIVERMAAGKEIAKSKPGYHEGRKKKYSQEQEKHALDLLGEGYSIKRVSDMTGISTATISRIKKRDCNG